jgi:photosynthetic reaction center cytochrome c subunit
MSPAVPTRIVKGFAVVALLGGVLGLAGCERPPMASQQQGFRGTGMVEIDNPRILAAAKAALPPVPDEQPAVPAEGPKAREVLQNVQVLGDLSVAEFTRTMAAITSWVAPVEGCNYCHNPANFAEDAKYTKVVARRMLEMTRTVNAKWGDHVAQTGVTCYTCHRGQPVPQKTWSIPVQPTRNIVGVGLGDDAGQNKAEPSIGYTSMPYDPFSDYLVGKDGIRVQGLTPLPTGNRQSIKQAEFTYSLMIHISEALGVNCTFCHNTQSFLAWNAARVKAWHGVRMARTINNEFVLPLAKTLPASRLGPAGDVPKVFCATCHQGVNKPLAGLQMAKAYPALLLPEVAPSSLPPPSAGPTKSVLYFAVDSAVLEGEQARGMARLVTTMAERTRTSVTISGYHSATGNAAHNHELAKQRAFTVRDALLAAGIAESRVVLAKPIQEQANIAGEDPAARRVEVTLN